MVPNKKKEEKPKVEPKAKKQKKEKPKKDVSKKKNPKLLGFYLEKERSTTKGKEKYCGNYANRRYDGGWHI